MKGTTLRTLLLFLALAACKEVPQHPLKQKGSGHVAHVQQSPSAVLGMLLAGNRRFYQDHPHRHTHEHKRLSQMAHEQHPQAVVVTCSDSRISPSLVFDQGLGQLFVIRTAGHVIGDYELGSIEYAVRHLNVPLVLVLGHYDCGAIKACMANTCEAYHIDAILQTIRSEEDEQRLFAAHDHNHGHFVEANVRYHTRLIRHSEPVLKERVASGQLRVVSAVLNEETGRVALLQDSLPPLKNLR